jgi:hypothetical protein
VTYYLTRLWTFKRFLVCLRLNKMSRSIDVHVRQPRRNFTRAFPVPTNRPCRGLPHRVEGLTFFLAFLSVSTAKCELALYHSIGLRLTRLVLLLGLSFGVSDCNRVAPTDPSLSGLPSPGLVLSECQSSCSIWKIYKVYKNGCPHMFL